MVYDSLGRKTAMGDPDMGYWQYGYDARGNLTSQLDAKNQTINFDYDALNRLADKRYPDGSTANYYYDAGTYGKGQRTSMSNISGNTSWQFDARGRTTQAAYTVNGLGTRTFNYTFDAADRVKTISYPGIMTGGETPISEVVTYNYDVAGHQASLCTTLQANCYIQSATYSALNQPIARQSGNSTQQNWIYSGPMQRLFQLTVGPNSTPNQYLSRNYAYDSVGNVNVIGDNTICQQQNFQYDEQNRLTRAATQDNCGQTRPDDYTQNVSYDQVGNITTKTGVGTYSYNNGHAHQVSQVGSTPISYDANGNANNGPNHIFNWNVDNQLASSSNQNDTEAYSYDADGERVARTSWVGSTTTTTYSVGGGMWEEDSNGTIRELYSFGGSVVAQRTYTPAPPRLPLRLVVVVPLPRVPQPPNRLTRCHLPQPLPYHLPLRPCRPPTRPYHRLIRLLVLPPRLRPIARRTLSAFLRVKLAVPRLRVGLIVATQRLRWQR